VAAMCMTWLWQFCNSKPCQVSLRADETADRNETSLQK
jgi:hypothetical protein